MTEKLVLQNKIILLEKLLTFALDNLSYLHPEIDLSGEELCDFDFCGICGRDEYSHKPDCAGIDWTIKTKKALGK